MSVSSRSRSHSESLTPNGRARDVSEQRTDYGTDRVTDDESVYGYGDNSHRYQYSPNSPTYTDYDADRVTDDESVHIYAGGAHPPPYAPVSSGFRPTSPQYTPNSPQFTPSPRFPTNSHRSPGYSPQFGPNSPGWDSHLAVSEQPAHDDPDGEDSDDTGYRIHTYVANAVHEPEEESSDSSIRVPTRRQRQPRQYSVPDREAVRVHDHNPFDPIFANSRGRMNGSRTNPINVDGAGDDWEGEIRRVIEPSSRSRRMTAYRNMPARRIDPLRSSRSPSVTRIISSSSRGSRYPRQYQRRG